MYLNNNDFIRLIMKFFRIFSIISGYFFRFSIYFLLFIFFIFDSINTAFFIVSQGINKYISQSEAYMMYMIFLQNILYYEV